MSDPKRLLDRGEGFATTLLRAGCDERPSAERMQRTLRAIGVTTVVGTVASEAAGGSASAVVSGLAGSTTAKVGASSVTLALAAKWVVIGALGGLATVGAASELARPRVQEQSATTTLGPTSLSTSRTAPNVQGSPVVAAQPSIAGDDRAEVSFSPSAAPPSQQRHTGADNISYFNGPEAGHGRSLRGPTPSGSPLVPSERREKNSDEADLASRGNAGSAPSTPSLHTTLPSEGITVPRDTASVAPTPSTDDDSDRARIGANELSSNLNGQVVLIERAWSDVKRNDPAGALRALASYERTFPALDLHPEVMFLRMTAESALGQTLGARANAARIVALYPQSAQAKRARELLARP